MKRKVYLGDSVYLQIDERGVVLTTENGYGPTNTIVLEPEVWFQLKRFVEPKTEEDAEGV